MALTGWLVSVAWGVSLGVKGAASGCLRDGGQDCRTRVSGQGRSATPHPTPPPERSPIPAGGLVTGQPQGAPQGTDQGLGPLPSHICNGTGPLPGLSRPLGSWTILEEGRRRCQTGSAGGLLHPSPAPLDSLPPPRQRGGELLPILRDPASPDLLWEY